MIIRDSSAGRVGNPYLRTLQTTEKTQRDASTREPVAANRDEVGISPEAIALQKAQGRAAASATDGEEVRWDKVNELRQRLVQGQYRVATDDLAQRLMGGDSKND